MGRKAVGSTSGADTEGPSTDVKPRRYRSNTGSFDQNRSNMDAGAATRFERKHSPPSVGDRFGELTVLGIERRIMGANAQDMVRVQCSCMAEPHLVYGYNLRKGASTRCSNCAKKQAGHWRKTFFKYADACPDDDHRRRLLNRLSACNTRCHNPTSKQYHSYGGRGIHVWPLWRKDKASFLRYVVTLEGWDNPAFDMDRIDVNKGYEPGNLRFIPLGENRGRNKRTVREMQQRILDLEARIRHLEQRPE